jgi:APA family basic amino acid/polyamine antiporter
MAALKRSLSFAEIVIMAIGNIIGAGVFLLLGSIIRYGSKSIVPIFLVATIFNIIAGLSYAELGAMYKSNSVEYDAIKDAFGPATAQIAVISLMFFLVVTINSLALMFGSYITDNTNWQFILSLVLILILSIISFFGIELSKLISNLFGGIKLATLVTIVTVGVFYIKFSSLKSPLENVAFTPLVYTSFLAIFLYNGYDAIVKMSEEMKDPEKDIPRSILTSIFICSLIYILISMIAISLNIKSIRPIDEIARTLFHHPIVGWAIYCIGIVTIFNTSFISTLALSRFIYGLSKQGFVPSVFSRVNENFQTPHNSILLVFMIVSAMLLVGNFETSVIINNACLMLYLLFMYLTIIVLRKKFSDKKRPFRVPFNVNDIPIPIVLGLLFIIGYIVFVPYMLNNHP